MAGQEEEQGHTCSPSDSLGDIPPRPVPPEQDRPPGGLARWLICRSECDRTHGNGEKPEDPEVFPETATGRRQREVQVIQVTEDVVRQEEMVVRTGSPGRTRLRVQRPRDPTAGERVAQASVSLGDQRLTLAYLRWGDRLRGSVAPSSPCLSLMGGSEIPLVK